MYKDINLKKKSNRAWGALRSQITLTLSVPSFPRHALGACTDTVETRRNINSLLLKHHEWLLKVDHALVAKTSDCQLCPRHCVNILAKTVAGSVGRKVKRK